MAKGDSARAQTQIDKQSQIGQGGMDTLNKTLKSQYSDINSKYQSAYNTDSNNYNEIMQRYRDSSANAATMGEDSKNTYKNMMNGAGDITMNPGDEKAVGTALEGYGNFAKTGGFSGDDISNLRARAISPTRAIYGQAQDELNRQRAIQGGYSPNFGAASARMAREQSQQASDANINANAGIAQMVQQGKLYGLTGLSTTGLGDAATRTQMGMANNANRLSGAAGSSGIDEARMDALLKNNAGMTSAYSATPGMTSTLGNQLTNTSGQMVNAQGLQNQLGLGLINGQIAKAGIPGDFAQAMGNIGGVLGNIVKPIGGLITGGLG